MNTTYSPEQAELVQLRWDAGYYKTHHEKALRREAEWKNKAERFERRYKSYRKRIKELIQQLRALKAKVACLQQQVFGRKSEQSQTEEDGNKNVAESELVSVDPGKRKRGKQPGSKGYGRKERCELPAEEILCDLPQDQKHCPRCHGEIRIFPGTEDSQEIHWEV